MPIFNLRATLAVAALLATPMMIGSLHPVSAQEAAAGMRDPGPQTRAELLTRIQARFDRMDADHDGRITRAEYDAAMAARADRLDRNGERRGDAMAGRAGAGGDAFDRMDNDHDGALTPAEFGARRLAMFDRADANHDGTVTPEERQAMREAMGGPGGMPPPPN